MSKIVVFGSLAESLINFRGSLLKKMVENGNDVFTCAPNASADIQAKLKALGVKYRNIPIDRVGLNPGKDTYTVFKLISLFREIKPDAILCYTIKPVLYGSFVGRMVGIPQVFSMITGLGYTFSSGGLKERFINVLVRLFYKLSLFGNTRIFFQNPDDRDLFQKLGLINQSEKAVLINGSGVDVNYFHLAPFPRVISFLLIARLLKDKGILEYIEAIKIVQKKYSEVKFRLVGWIDKGSTGISQHDLDLWIQDGTVEYLGKLDDVRTAIADTSIYLLPSYREGTPRTVLEAMSMGRPIITTDAPGCRETVTHGRNGFLVPIRDSVALAEAMEQFVRNPDLIKKMGNESRKIAEDKYDVRKVNEVIMNAMNLP